MTEAECIALKQQAFRKYFHSLNEQQQQISRLIYQIGSNCFCFKE